jgi:uncharacterized membrane protein
MLPVIELRGAIPLGAGFGLPFLQNYCISVIGNLIPVPFILLFIRRILYWMKNSRIHFFSTVANFVFKKAYNNRSKIEKYSFWGLFLFVAIPIPGTGAWTGSLVAALLEMKFYKAILSVLLGVLCAGLIMSAVSYGFIGLISTLF